MTSVIWKFPVSPLANVIDIPKGAYIIAAGIQQNTITLWAIVDPDADLIGRRIEVFGTGHHLPGGSRTYIGIVFDGPYVWHVFDGGECV